MLRLKTTITGLALDNTSLTFADATGAYATPANEGGYGTPNPALADFRYVSLSLKLQGRLEATIYQDNETDNPGVLATLAAGKEVDYTFGDGVYTATMWLGMVVTDTFNISVPNVITGLNAVKALTAGYTHVSFPSAILERRKVMDATGMSLTVDAVLPSSLTSPQASIIYWWQGETKFLTDNKANIQIAKRLAVHACDCKEELELACNLMRAEGLFLQQDYAGAQLLLDYAKGRLRC